MPKKTVKIWPWPLIFWPKNQKRSSSGAGQHAKTVQSLKSENNLELCPLTPNSIHKMRAILYPVLWPQIQKRSSSGNSQHAETVQSLKSENDLDFCPLTQNSIHQMRAILYPVLIYLWLVLPYFLWLVLWRQAFSWTARRRGIGDLPPSSCPAGPPRRSPSPTR